MPTFDIYTKQTVVEKYNCQQSCVISSGILPRELRHFKWNILYCQESCVISSGIWPGELRHFKSTIAKRVASFQVEYFYIAKRTASFQMH